MKSGFTKPISRWTGKFIPHKILKIIKGESSLITITSKKCAKLVHINTPNGKSINIPIGGIVVIIRYCSQIMVGSVEHSVYSSTLDRDRRKQKIAALFLLAHRFNTTKGWCIQAKNDKFGFEKIQTVSANHCIFQSVANWSTFSETV